MANEVLTQKVCEFKVDSGGTPVTLKFEEPGTVTIKLPKINKRFVQDRGVNTSTQVEISEEQIEWSLTADECDDQEAANIWKLLDGTNDCTFTEAYTGGTITHTLKYCQAEVSKDPNAQGRTFTVTGTAQGWNDGTNLYGLQA